jgi:hypothetical protein
VFSHKRKLEKRKFGYFGRDLSSDLIISNQIHHNKEHEMSCWLGSDSDNDCLMASIPEYSGAGSEEWIECIDVLITPKKLMFFGQELSFYRAREDSQIFLRSWLERSYRSR